MEGLVFIEDRRIDKPGEKVNVDSPIVVKENPLYMLAEEVKT